MIKEYSECLMAKKVPVFVKICVLVARPMTKIATFQVLWRPLSYLAPPNCVFVNGIDAVHSIHTCVVLK